MNKATTLKEQVERATARLALLEKQTTDPFDTDNRISKQNLKIDDREKQDIREALRIPAIRRFFFRVLNMAQILGDSSDPNPYVVMHHTGRRSLGLQIYRILIDAEPGIYLQMTHEAASDRKSIQNENEGES